MSSSVPDPIVAWVVDDHAAYAAEVRLLLSATGEIACPGVFHSAEDLLGVDAGASAPNVILMDLQLPGMDGTTGIRRASERWPSAAMVALTIHDSDDWIVAAICAGAVGYLWKPASGAELRAAVLTAHAGGSPMHPGIARRAIALLKQSRDRPPTPKLTARELEILELLVRGETQTQIAHRLGISAHTVDTHVRHVYAALKTSSRAATVARAIRDRLV